MASNIHRTMAAEGKVEGCRRRIMASSKPDTLTPPFAGAAGRHSQGLMCINFDRALVG